MKFWVIYLLQLCALVLIVIQPVVAQELPGHTDLELGTINLTPRDSGDGPECELGEIAVPENRAAEKTRNIRLYFYRFKAREKTDLPPVVFLPGGPGGYYNDNWVDGLKSKPKSGSNLEAWRYAENRDVLLINQRGARLPDRSYELIVFTGGFGSARKPHSTSEIADAMQKGAKLCVQHWQEKGVDLAGYDIMNMVEDIDDIREALGYEKLVLRGTSFGSQWSMSYMKQHPDRVDRAILGGVEPIDHGWDSPQGIWNVFKRIESQIESKRKTNPDDFPSLKLTDAIKEIVQRLEEPITVEAKYPNRKRTRKIPIGREDFQNYLRDGIFARRESRDSLQNFPKFIYEIHGGDYSYLGGRILEERGRPRGGSLQAILIDNSLGISQSREAKLDSEPAMKWLGDLNSIYRSTREVTPTPVVSDEFRKLESDTPVLMIMGDMDRLTPFENATDQIHDFSNAHLLRIGGGTHGAFGEIAEHDPEFMDMVVKFLEADFSKGSVSDLGIPARLDLPALKYKPITEATLFEQWQQSKQP